MKPDLKRGKDPERLITTLGRHSRGLRLVTRVYFTQRHREKLTAKVKKGFYPEKFKK
jgi:hypothetical protein